MSDHEYLEAVFAEQALKEGSPELRQLRQHRKEVEELLRKRFGSTPSIRYGGSKAKRTMNRESYDLDITCYFPRDDDSAAIRSLRSTIASRPCFGSSTGRSARDQRSVCGLATTTALTSISMWCRDDS
jgi:tRNA nucleotidyltransferase (CCA-adding enzyme)